MVPGIRLTRLDLSSCASLLMLPDLSHLKELEVNAQGCNSDLMLGWERNMRKAFAGTFGSQPGFA